MQVQILERLPLTQTLDISISAGFSDINARIVVEQDAHGMWSHWEVIHFYTLDDACEPVTFNLPEPMYAVFCEAIHNSLMEQLEDK